MTQSNRAAASCKPCEERLPLSITVLPLQPGHDLVQAIRLGIQNEDLRRLGQTVDQRLVVGDAGIDKTRFMVCLIGRAWSFRSDVRGFAPLDRHPRNETRPCFT